MSWHTIHYYVLSLETDRPIITFALDDIIVIEGDIFPSRECSAVGNPTPTVTWLYNGNINGVESLESNSLNIPTIQRDQAGIYTCHAEASSMGSHGILTSEKFVQVIVHCKSFCISS